MMDLRIAKRGTYCEAAVPEPPKSYFGARQCAVRGGFKKHRGVWLCAIHRRAKEWR